MHCIICYTITLDEAVWSTQLLKAADVPQTSCLARSIDGAYYIEFLLVFF